MKFLRTEKGYKVESDSGNEYQVWVKDGVAAFCDCPGFKFRKGDIKDRPPCKHMLAVSRVIASGGKIDTPIGKVNVPRQAPRTKTQDPVTEAFEKGLRGATAEQNLLEALQASARERKP